MKEFLKNNLSNESIDLLRRKWTFLSGMLRGFMYPYGRFIKTPINLLRTRSSKNRRLEIGPGPERIPGFETVNVVWGSNVDYVADASKKLPFKSGTFDLVYASHILEHIPWYQVEPVLLEWVRILSSGGHLEIWVPNGLLIAKTFVNAEEGVANTIHEDGWYKFNEKKDPCIWANGRIFSYGDGTGRKQDPNWHLTIFSPRYLRELFDQCGLIEIEQLDRSAVRGHDHGWINLGFRGRKP